MPDLDPIAAQLVAARIAAGMSQAELSRLSGVHPATICEMESGKHLPKLPKLRAIAKALGFVPVLTAVRREDE